MAEAGAAGQKVAGARGSGSEQEGGTRPSPAGARVERAEGEGAEGDEALAASEGEDEALRGEEEDRGEALHGPLGLQ
jgi:hypothetical protein